MLEVKRNYTAKSRKISTLVLSYFVVIIRFLTIIYAQTIFFSLFHHNVKVKRSNVNKGRNKDSPYAVHTGETSVHTRNKVDKMYS